jgi:hypothetical protein
VSAGRDHKHRGIRWRSRECLLRKKLATLLIKHLQPVSFPVGLNVAGVLNALAKVDSTRQAPGFDAINSIRKQQAIARRSPSAHNRAHDEFIGKVAASVAAGGEGFNRLHPKSKLAAASATIGADDARDQRYTPDLAAARKLLDAAGRLASSDPRARDHWSSGKQESIAAQFLLSEARRLIAEMRAQEARAVAENQVAGRMPGAGAG